MESTPRPNPYDATQPHFRASERRPLRASAYWIVFGVAAALWMGSSTLSVAVLAGSWARPELVIALVSGITMVCSTIGGVALGLAVATGIRKDRTRLLVGIAMAVVGVCSVALWQLFLHGAGIMAALGTRQVIGAFASPLLIAGVVCLLAGLRVRNR